MCSFLCVNTLTSPFPPKSTLPRPPQFPCLTINHRHRSDLLLLFPSNAKPLAIPNFCTSLPWRRPTPLAPAFAVPDASSAEVDMVQGRDGTWSSKTDEKVVVLWDLDNKPPRGPPYDAAMSLRRLASLFGTVVDVSAYANRHAFIHLPRWVLDQRRERRELEILERKGLSVPSEPYLCGVCGRKCRTQLDLRKHFRQLHERERNKKVARMRSLKGKKRQRYRERFVAGNTKYEEAARELINPKTGYGLARELRRAGVFVKTVADKPQSADSALKRQMQHSMARGIDWLFLVSDDSDFTEMVRRAKESDLRTVVVGDWRTTLGRHADIWVPWAGVESGEVGEEVMRSGGWRNGAGVEDLFSTADDFDSDGGHSDLDVTIDEIIVGNSGSGGLSISAFSEEEEGGRRGNLDDDDFRIYGSSLPGDQFLWDSEDDEGEDYYEL